MQPGHRAKAGLREPVRAPALEFRGNLVPPGRAARTALDYSVVVEAERKQHRLFQPLIDFPRPGAHGVWNLLRDPRLAAVEQRQCLLDGVANIARVPASIAARSSKACSISVCRERSDIGRSGKRRPLVSSLTSRMSMPARRPLGRHCHHDARQRTLGPTRVILANARIQCATQVSGKGREPPPGSLNGYAASRPTGSPLSRG